MAVTLTLGPVLFSGFEIPDNIKFPIKQTLAIKRLAGGAKDIQATGRDDQPIRWSGRFRGSDAETRARLLHYLAAQGKPLELAWSTLRYQVVIEEFEPNFMQPFEIPYSISCVVVVDETSPLLNALFGLDTAIGSDLNNVVQIGSALNLPGVSKAISGITSATSTILTYQGAAASTLSAVTSAVGVAQGAVSAASTAGNAVVTASGTVGGVTAGGDPASMASGLVAQATAFANLGNLANIQASLGRMATNLTSAVI